jgi:hypothetical protein
MIDSSKLFENPITRRLREHLKRAGVQANNQYGFKSGKSTVDAMSRLLTIVRNANGRGHARNEFVGMLTLNIKNTFNSVPWETILQRLERIEAPNYLRIILSQYMSNRRITFTKEVGSTCGIYMNCGVPQG